MPTENCLRNSDVLERLQDVFAESRGVLGALWGVLRASWEHLGTSGELLGGVWRRRGKQNRLGALLEPFSGRPGSVLKPFWGRLGASWRRHGAVLWASSGVLEPSCEPFGTTESVLEPAYARFHLGYNL